MPWQERKIYLLLSSYDVEVPGKVEFNKCDRVMNYILVSIVVMSRLLLGLRKLMDEQSL